MDRSPHLDLSLVRSQLQKTARGKHVGPSSYFHVETIRTHPCIVEVLNATWRRFAPETPDYNVVKLQPPSRVSFLTYHDFASPFPVLDHSLAINLAAGSARHTDYRDRGNPPILHRKELILRAGHPNAIGAAELTARLEARGAFANPRRIGTVDGWSRALTEVGLALDRGKVVGW